MSGDVRVSNPNGTSIYDQLSIKSEKPVQQQQPKQEKPVIQTKDNNGVSTPTGKKDAPSVDLVDNNSEKVKSLPLLNSDTGEVLKFKTDAKGMPILNDQGQLQPDEKGKPVFVKVDENEQPIVDQDGEPIFVESAGNIPASNLSLTDDSPTSVEENKPTENVDNNSGQKDSGKIAPLVNPETGETLSLKVDEKGVPVLDQNGQLQHDPNGKPAFIKLDEKGEPLLNEKGEPQFVNPDGQSMPGLPPQIQKAMTDATNAMTTHSVKRVITGMSYGKMATGLTSKIASTMIKGVSVGIPFTKVAVGFGVKHAVAKAVTAEIAKISTKALAKGGTTTIVAATKVATTTATQATVKALTNGKVLGKGLEALAAPTIKSVITSPVITSKAVAESAKLLKPVVTSGAKVYAKTVQKAVVGAGEKALEKGLTKGIEKGMEAAIKRGGVEIVEKVTTKAAQKSIEKAATTAATKAATTGTAKAGSKLASAVPIIGAVAGAAIVAWDTKDAIEKTRDKNTTKLSAGLAWTTVALGTISTVCTATGVGAPIGWVATGLSIGTSIASDYFRYKK